MNKKDFNAVLEVALLLKGDVSELRIRYLFSDHNIEEIIKEGKRIYEELDSKELNSIRTQNGEN